MCFTILFWFILISVNSFILYANFYFIEENCQDGCQFHSVNWKPGQLLRLSKSYQDAGWRVEKQDMSWEIRTPGQSSFCLLPQYGLVQQFSRESSISPQSVSDVLQKEADEARDWKDSSHRCFSQRIQAPRPPFRHSVHQSKSYHPICINWTPWLT